MLLKSIERLSNGRVRLSTGTRFAYVLNRDGRIEAVDSDGPDGRKHTTFNVQGYVVRVSSGREGTSWERDETNTIQRATVWCSGKKPEKVSAPAHQYGSEESTEAELRRQCAQLAALSMPKSY